MINYINFLHDKHLFIVDEKERERKKKTPMDFMDRQ